MLPTSVAALGQKRHLSMQNDIAVECGASKQSGARTVREHRPRSLRERRGSNKECQF